MVVFTSVLIGEVSMLSSSSYLIVGLLRLRYRDFPGQFAGEN